MGDSKTLYCPKCYCKLGAWDGKSITTKAIKCRKCNRLVLFKDGKYVRSEEVPKRNTASGITFH